MHIVPDAEDPHRIYFHFFQDSDPYNFIGKESAVRHSFDAAIVANDLREQQDQS